ncbi:AbrB/MazE/SpoVT family DNA-binding domain-containing protein [Roseococcus sp. SYP-B2431]|uniref:AbrB/MazE/SpoVT family DNA-binding domain-containing protein n=1 Tax=Roseococcus sp. SYP-B2431 TaxID=2496640 RepID=UPI00103DCFAD|nr:AbrB/MazE/SpoVT family DNA-binding domain-containing protein [Roseococcus sp. SYP-B2431]TCI00112.1 AbrB/MazE/SpoVT family DNA-binding domain-containing protein [Roseococcus sp. SYP-B2431]
MGMPITVKGQVTIPKPMRDHLGLEPGSRVEFEALPDGSISMRKAPDQLPVPDRFGALRGCGTALPDLTADEVMQLMRGDDD